MTSRIHVALFLVGSFFCSCTGQAISIEPGTAHQEVVISPPVQAPVNSEPTAARAVLDAKGLIVLGDSQSRELLLFYNADGTVWYEFTFYYDDSDGNFEYANENFLPFSFHPDYFSLALRVVGEDRENYEVVVNEEVGIKKYIRKKDKKFRFITWEKHILATFAVDFNKRSNPVLQAPGGEPKDISSLSIDRFGAKSFDGDWLRVEWDITGSEHDDDMRKDSGWIRWRDGNLLLIDWFYFA